MQYMYSIKIVPKLRSVCRHITMFIKILEKSYCTSKLAEVPFIYLYKYLLLFKIQPYWLSVVEIYTYIYNI